MLVRLRRQLLGLVFLALLLLASWLAYADYRHVFADDVEVTARLAGGTGMLLAPEADVKVRGVVVGQVRTVTTTGGDVTARLALDPDHADEVPATSRARLLPSTMFGDPFVDLVGARVAASPPVEEGDVLAADRSTDTVALQRVLADVHPLLRAVRPADLNATLYALSHALEGRGEAIGDNLERVDAYLRRLNPHVDTLGRNAGAFADVAHAYADATPDLARLLRHTAATGRTLSSQRAHLDAFFAGVTGAAEQGRVVVGENEANLVRLARVSRPVLDLYARYAPEYPCLAAGLARYHPRLADVFRQAALHITLEVVRHREPYDVGEGPVYGDSRGPDCQKLPDPPVPGRLPHGGPITDGSDGPQEYEGQSGHGGGDVGRLLTGPLRH